jgi:hypothetical protein
LKNKAKISKETKEQANTERCVMLKGKKKSKTKNRKGLNDKSKKRTNDLKMTLSQLYRQT